MTDSKTSEQTEPATHSKPTAKSVVKPTPVDTDSYFSGHVCILRGKEGLVGIYQDGKLIATHDKHTESNGDLGRVIQKYVDMNTALVEDNSGEFSTFADIPEQYAPEGV